MIRGGTYEIEVSIVDNDTNSPLDLTNAEGILVALYGDGNRIFGKWSLVAKPDYGVVTITNAVGGVITVHLEADESLKAIEKMARLEVKVALPNIDFEDSLQISIATDVEIETVKRSIFEGISPV